VAESLRLDCEEWQSTPGIEAGRDDLDGSTRSKEQRLVLQTNQECRRHFTLTQTLGLQNIRSTEIEDQLDTGVGAHLFIGILGRIVSLQNPETFHVIPKRCVR